jgi:membrane associated rhomboid family serine protease
MSDLVWRVFTGSLVHIQLLQLLFSLLSYVPTAINQEKIDGTVKHAFKFLATSVIIQSLFVLACFTLSVTVNPRFMTTMSVGLWPILFCDIVIECNRSPDVARG